MTYEDYMKLPMTKEDAKEILKMEIDWDWEKFRREAAKDYTVALVSSGSGLSPKTISYAIEMANELIRQLKEEK